MKALYRHYQPEILGALFCLTLGLISGFSVSAGDSLWYSHLIKPDFTPPKGVFAPVWSMLYIMIGITLGVLWRNKHKNKILLKIFALQLLFNLLWSPIFFYFQRIDLALLDLRLLWLTLVAFMILSYRIRRVFFLFFPYFIWVTFALILNTSIYNLNRFHH